jgi:hypothetical protein
MGARLPHPILRSMKIIAIAALVLFAVASPALAFQCPKLITQINGAANARLDATAYDARNAAVEVGKLHTAGKHAESEKLAKETLAKLGIK